MIAAEPGADVLGAAFYLMAPVEGFNVRLELADAQRYLTGSFPLTIETPSAIALQVIHAVFYGLDLEELQTFRERVNAVTVMSYRDTATGANSMTAVGADMLTRASAAGKNVRLAAETQNLPDCTHCTLPGSLASAPLDVAAAALSCSPSNLPTPGKLRSIT